ncbi:M48 family metallopeptidase [Pelomonas sp. KK5]|uniref:M48 family metallopeptidase n=1 Tax=Pelomonas sp. KK5 TaxID=1855730 RepID=UPI00097C20DA|nr:M48 family metallopeptidase [Pelomonas sp. KK5]
MASDFEFPEIPVDAPVGGCSCHGRRLFSALLLGAALPAVAQQPPPREGVDVGETSKFARLVPAAQVEQAGAQQYAQLMQQAAAKRALAPPNQPQLVRLREIAKRIIVQAPAWNARAKQWRWEVNLVADQQLNAFCMPGGKIAFFYGILEKLKLSDDEVAMVMGHEVAHALREHARERMGKNAGTSLVVSGLSALLGLGNVGDAVLRMGGQLMTLTFSREDESEADLVGMELASRAGYDPRASVTLWQKMGAAAKGAPPQWLSTHPAGPTRIRDLQANLPKVMPLYERAEKPAQRFEIAPPLKQRAG